MVYITILRINVVFLFLYDYDRFMFYFEVIRDWFIIIFTTYHLLIAEAWSLQNNVCRQCYFCIHINKILSDLTRCFFIWNYPFLYYSRPDFSFHIHMHLLNATIYYKRSSYYKNNTSDHMDPVTTRLYLT